MSNLSKGEDPKCKGPSSAGKDEKCTVVSNLGLVICIGDYFLTSSLGRHKRMSLYSSSGRILRKLGRPLLQQKSL